jgi:hypothetical protein
MTAPPRLHLGHDAELDWLMAYEFGRVEDSQPSGSWRALAGTPMRPSGGRAR